VTRLRHLRRQARLAWHVFRGRPLAYRVKVRGALHLVIDRTWVDSCLVLYDGNDGAIESAAHGCILTDNVARPAPGYEPPRLVLRNHFDPPPDMSLDEFVAKFKEAARRGHIQRWDL
jgi:hypothetical protein